jgi:hyperosmotically inducible periplasmic protein
MKKYVFLMLAAFAFVTMSQSCKKKVKDDDIQKELMAKVSGMGDMMKGGNVTVKDGVAIITGECKDQECHDKCKKDLEDAKIKGVKELKFECTVAPKIEMPAMPSADDTKITDAIAPMLKDMKGAAVTVASGVATVTGVADVAKRAAVKQALIKAGAKNVEFK